MRILCTVFVVATVVLALGAKLPAGEPQTKGGLVESIQDLDLTDDQEAKISDIVKEFKTKNGEALKELGAVVKEEKEKVSAVLTAEQRATVERLKEERKDTREDCLAHRIAHLKELDLTDDELSKIGDIRSEFRPQIAKAMKGLESLLSNEQKAARETGLKAGKKRREVLASLKLTADQKTKVAAVAKEAGALVREEVEKIRDVLAAGEKEPVQELQGERKELVRDRLAHRIANLSELNLTADQKTKLTDIRKEFRPKVQEAGNQVRASVREEIGTIAAVIKG